MLSKIGVRTVDVGMSMLSMHSIRETVRRMTALFKCVPPHLLLSFFQAGSHDVQSYIDLFESFFEGFATVDKDLRVD